jgi:hypothetical protein
LADGFDFTFGFNFYGQLKNIYKNNQPVTILNSLNNSEFVNATDGQQVVRYLTNHDVNGSDGTPLDLFGGIPGSTAAFVVVAYMKGCPDDLQWPGSGHTIPSCLSFHRREYQLDTESGSHGHL